MTTARERTSPPSVCTTWWSPSDEMLVDLPAGEEPGAEADRLVAGALGQPHAGDPAREPQVVADHRRRAGLATDGLGLDDDGGQTLGRAVHGRREARRTRAHDAEVHHRAEVDGVGSSVDRRGHLPHAWPAPSPRGTASPRAASVARPRSGSTISRPDVGVRARRRGAASPSGRGSHGSPASARPGSAPRASPSRPRAARPSSPSRTAARRRRCGTPRPARRVASAGRRRTCPCPGRRAAARRPGGTSPTARPRAAWRSGTTCRQVWKAASTLPWSCGASEGKSEESATYIATCPPVASISVEMSLAIRAEVAGRMS